MRDEEYMRLAIELAKEFKNLSDKKSLVGTETFQVFVAKNQTV